VTPPSDDDRVVVIGSGPTGAVAAARLVERGARVTMLDAGTRAPRGLLVKVGGNTLFRTVSGTEFVTDRLSPSSADEVDWYSSLSLGGLSNYWTAAVPRYAPTDFDEGAKIDERFEWPLSYDDLEPEYDEIERLLEVTAGDEDIPGIPASRARYRTRPPADWRRLMEDANRAGHAVGVLPMAKGRPWMIARRAREFGSYHCIIAPMLEDRSFELRRGAHAVGLNWNAATSRVDGVEYVDVATGEQRRVRCRAVVVAAGAIDSTVLLLRSTSDDFPTGLGNTSGVIGRYLHDHPRDWWVAAPSRPLRALAHPVYIAREPRSTDDPLMATSLTIGLPSALARLKTYVRGSSSSFGVQVFGTMVPRPDIGVSLEGTDVAAVDVHPRISLEFDDRTRANLVSARVRLRDIFADAGLDVTIPGPFYDLRPGSAVHFGGTVRMHRSPSFGALDEWSRLHDVRNVVVADSSAFTTGPEKNPTLTAMALAARGASRLADDLRSGAV
jgi:choline dehydrogenase-like flavoprotein